MADLFKTAGADRLICVDLHADQIQGFFDVPVDNVYSTPVLLGDVWKHNYDNLCDRCCNVLVTAWPNHESVPHILAAREEQKRKWTVK